MLSRSIRARAGEGSAVPFPAALLPREEPLENSLRLLPQGPIGELLLQFRFQLRRYEFEQFRIVRYERLTDVLRAEEQLVSSRAELHGASKMVLIKPPVRF